MRIVASLGLIGLTVMDTQGAAQARQQVPWPIEVRMEAKQAGESFAYAGGQKVELEPVALLAPAHFARVEVRASRNPNTPGTYEIEASHTAQGRRLLHAAADFARDRRYCVLTKGVVQSCSGFAPEPKRIFDRSQSIDFKSESDARRTANAIAQSISAAAAEERKLTSQTRLANPQSLLELLYKRTHSAGGSQWISGGEREAFLSRALIELWEKVDARIATGDNEVVLDADPVTATNGLEMRSYRVAIERQTPAQANASVTVNYQSPSKARQVRYTLVRENGRWRIADIGRGENSMKASLARFVEPPNPSDNR